MDRDGSGAAGGERPPVAAAGPAPSSRLPPSPGIEALAADKRNNIIPDDASTKVTSLDTLLWMLKNVWTCIEYLSWSGFLERATACIALIHVLNAEALAFDREGNEESIDVAVQKALECPCLDDLKRGPCGSQFIDAFSCYLKSTKEEKGSDCVDPFIALQNCIRENKEAFIKEILEEEENDEEAEKSNLKVLPPAWSRERKSKIRGPSK